jgi:Flp pilus assembly protein TadG
MRRLPNLAAGLIRSEKGLAAVEFSMILPIMLVMLVGVFDGTNAFAVYGKTRFATATLAELTNQYTTIHDADLTQILGATSTVLAPYSSAAATTSVSQIAINASGVATVSWSNTLTPGSTFTLPSGLATPSSYLIYCQVSYTFTPSFSSVFTGPITLSDSIYVSPRNSSSITRVSP